MGADSRPWWEAAPLDEAGCRSLAALPAADVVQLVEAGKVLARHAVRSQRRALQELLGDADDLDQQLTTWILEAAVTYDPARGPWQAHLVQRVRQLAADHWRVNVGRAALQMLQRQRELGDTALAPGEHLQVRRIRSLLPGAQHRLDRDTELIPAVDDSLARIEERSVRTQITRALLDAGFATGAEHPRLQRALVAYLLCQVHGFSQRRVAACGIHHRTLTALDQDLRARLRALVRQRP
ncbi:hypothetical protein M8C13_38625 [Crossiella sp. SN42]|uniref:hypothetical protein n=1 Tax=Crossiella sp. SN42 TaxID=2944808 RepID=UPI00207C45D2|nr:hypothetical protein [Crossiella sp. SN42]MCO1581681.1 hypothetical protein [Crossiella sp. SN42]